MAIYVIYLSNNLNLHYQHNLLIKVLRSIVIKEIVVNLYFKSLCELLEKQELLDKLKRITKDISGFNLKKLKNLRGFSGSELIYSILDRFIKFYALAHDIPVYRAERDFNLNIKKFVEKFTSANESMIEPPEEEVKVLLDRR